MKILIIILLFSFQILGNEFSNEEILMIKNLKEINEINKKNEIKNNIKFENLENEIKEIKENLIILEYIANITLFLLGVFLFFLGVVLKDLSIGFEKTPFST
jgi:hypothetical protein